MEWVGAQGSGVLQEQRPNPATKLSPHLTVTFDPNITKRIKEQAADAKLTTDMTSSFMMSDQIEAKLNEFPHSLTQDRSNTTCEMSSKTQLDLNQQVSLESNSNELPLSLVDGLGPETMNTLQSPKKN